jgi:hypothetical protein
LVALVHHLRHHVGGFLAAASTVKHITWSAITCLLQSSGVLFWH